jgi:hypothetical protein
MHSGSLRKPHGCRHAPPLPAEPAEQTEPEAVDAGGGSERPAALVGSGEAVGAAAVTAADVAAPLVIVT